MSSIFTKRKLRCRHRAVWRTDSLNLPRRSRRMALPSSAHNPPILNAREDRKEFSAMLDKLKLLQTPGSTTHQRRGSHRRCQSGGYLVIVRPSFVLGGRAEVVYTEEDLAVTFKSTVDASPELSHPRPDRFLEEVPLKWMSIVCSDGETCVIGGVMEHIEQAGIHSGDSACVIPTSPSLQKSLKPSRARQGNGHHIELQVRGLMNVQFAIKDDEVYVLEVNTRLAHGPFCQQGNRRAARQDGGENHGWKNAQGTWLHRKKSCPSISPSRKPSSRSSNFPAWIFSSDRKYKIPQRSDVRYRLWSCLCQRRRCPSTRITDEKYFLST